MGKRFVRDDDPILSDVIDGIQAPVVGAVRQDRRPAADPESVADDTLVYSIQARSIGLDPRY